MVADGEEQSGGGWFHYPMETDTNQGAATGKAPARELPILYVKTGCPWCVQAVEFLDGHGVSYRLKDVTADAVAFAEMQRRSGQTRAPTLDWDGKILADFGTEELIPFLRQQNVKLEDS